MGDLINEILAQLKAEASLKLVSIWNNQFDFLEDGKGYAFPFPCAFIELSTENFQNVGESYQSIDATLNIHIGQDVYNGSYMDENTTIFTLRDAVVRKMSNFKPSKAGNMMKTSEQQDYNHSNVYHYIISYQFHFIDNTSVKQEYSSTPPTNWRAI